MEDRRKLLAFAWGLLNSDYAGHRLPFELFAQSPLFARLNAVHNNFDFSSPLDFVRRAAVLSERTMKHYGAMVGRDGQVRMDASRPTMLMLPVSGTNLSLRTTSNFADGSNYPDI